MTLEELSYLSQIIGVAAIFASLVFVGLQIRQNTLATRAASHNAVSNALNDINRMFAENADLTKVWLAGMADRQALTPEERWRFDSTMRAYMHVCETMFIQVGLGAGEKSVLRAEEEGIKVAFASPGMRDWWAENPYGFCPEFRSYVAKLVRSAEVVP